MFRPLEAWDWASFWTELAAGSITFALGVIAAYFLLRHELSEARRADEAEFRNLAGEVCSDLGVLEILLSVWLDLVKTGKPILPIDPPQLTWDIDPAQLRYAFARRGVHATAQAAIDWFKNAVAMARQWNVELRSGLTEETERKTMSAVSGALERVRSAAVDIKAAAKLT